jgi:hypothetical protein
LFPRRLFRGSVGKVVHAYPADHRGDLVRIEFGASRHPFMAAVAALSASHLPLDAWFLRAATGESCPRFAEG